MVRARDTELGRGPDMRRSVPTGSLLVSQPKARKKNSAAGEYRARKKCVFYLYIRGLRMGAGKLAPMRGLD